jgi:hypothetical protein
MGSEYRRVNPTGRSRQRRPRDGWLFLEATKVQSDNPTDLGARYFGIVPNVCASLDVMARDAAAQWKGRPFVMANMKTGEGVDQVIAPLRDKGGLAAG